MQIYNIKKLLNISQYKITQTILSTDKEIHKISHTKSNRVGYFWLATK